MPDEDPAQLILDGPPLYCDGWDIVAGLWRPRAESTVHPFDAGPELVLPVPGGKQQPFLFEEAILQLESGYHHKPEHPMRLEWWRVPATPGSRPELVSYYEGFELATGWELGVSCGQPFLQSIARGHQLRILGPWGVGATAGGLTLRLAYLTELIQPPAGDMPL